MKQEAISFKAWDLKKTGTADIKAPDAPCLLHSICQQERNGTNAALKTVMGGKLSVVSQPVSDQSQSPGIALKSFEQVYFLDIYSVFCYHLSLNSIFPVNYNCKQVFVSLINEINIQPFPECTFYA